MICIAMFDMDLYVCVCVFVYLFPKQIHKTLICQQHPKIEGL